MTLFADSLVISLAGLQKSGNRSLHGVYTRCTVSNYSFGPVFLFITTAGDTDIRLQTSRTDIDNNEPNNISCRYLW
jgi:hypothetical protein